MAEKQNTAVRFLFHCSATGREVTDVRLAVSSNNTIDCTKSGKNCYGRLKAALYPILNSVYLFFVP